MQAVVGKRQMRELLPDEPPGALALATGLGPLRHRAPAPAVALARSLFRKGANFAAAMAFRSPPRNLVVELGIILAVLIGWQITAGEFLGGPIMIALMALLFQRFLKPAMVEHARAETDRGALGRREADAEMDISVTDGATTWRKLRSPRL